MSTTPSGVRDIEMVMMRTTGADADGDDGANHGASHFD